MGGGETGEAIGFRAEFFQRRRARTFVNRRNIADTFGVLVDDFGDAGSIECEILEFEVAETLQTLEVLGAHALLAV